jgi:hypothetical protein
VPTQPSGYSGTPLPKKLGIKPGHRVSFIHAPEIFAATLGTLPEGVAIVEADAGALDLALFFTTRADALPGAFRQLGPRVHPDGTLWIGWPRKASKVPTDVTEDVVRAVGLAEGDGGREGVCDRCGVVGAQVRLPAGRPAVAGRPGTA